VGSRRTGRRNHRDLRAPKATPLQRRSRTADVLLLIIKGLGHFGTPKKRGYAGASADEHGIEAFTVQQLRNCKGLADHLVGLENHAQVLKPLDLAIDDVMRQAKRLQHAAHHVQRFVNGNFGAVSDQVGGGGQAGRTGAHDRDPSERLLEARRRNRPPWDVVAAV
jgi:hypothetical protein